MPLIQIIIDDSTSKIITGTYEFDRANGGTLLVPSGSSFPGTPAAKELFWRTDEAKLYRRSDANDAWVAVVSAVAAHATTHQPGGSDAMTIDAAAATGSLRTIGTGALQACAGNDARLSDARTPTAHSTSHKHGGSDEVATATPAANAIPKADGSSKLDGWVTANAAAGTPSLRQLGTGATDACAGNDGRLSDARTPTAHKTSHEPGGSDALTVDAAAVTGSLRTIGTGALQACAGNDARLSDARTPTAHASTHKGDGADAIAVATTSVAGLESAADKTKLDGIATGATNTPLSSTAPVNVTKSTASAGVATEASRQDHKHDVTTAAPGATGVATTSGEGSATSLARSDHTHQSNTAPANVTKAAAAIGTSGEPARADHKHDVSTAAAGAATPGDTVAEGTATSLARSDHRHSLPAFGTGAGTFCQGNDSRLSDARTPTAHATSHQSGGSDAVKLDDLAAPDDNTDLNASASAHGLLRKLSNVSTEFLNGQGNWATPAGGSPVFGSAPQLEVSEGTSTTTSSTMQDKVTLTTPALTGTYRVAFFCEIMIGTANARHQCQLYNVTDAAELCFDDARPSLASMYAARSGFQYVTFAGAAKTFKVQFASQNNSATVTIRRARIEFWRIS